jgi:hypothetical protein
MIAVDHILNAPPLVDSKESIIMKGLPPRRASFQWPWLFWLPLPSSDNLEQKALALLSH